METLPYSPRALREEDLASGQAWTHPETCFEYADFHSYLRGEARLDHWRNNLVAQVWQDRFRIKESCPTHEDFVAYVRERHAKYCRCYTRNGEPFAARPDGAPAEPDYWPHHSYE